MIPIQNWKHFQEMLMSSTSKQCQLRTAIIKTEKRSMWRKNGKCTEKHGTEIKRNKNKIVNSKTNSGLDVLDNPCAVREVLQMKLFPSMK